MLASELESRLLPNAVYQAETLFRLKQEEAESLEKEVRRGALLRKAADDAIRFAPSRLRIAADLEKAGKIASAIEFYRLIARDVPQTNEGRTAVERIAALEMGSKSP